VLKDTHADMTENELLEQLAELRHHQDGKDEKELLKYYERLHTNTDYLESGRFVEHLTYFCASVLAAMTAYVFYDSIYGDGKRQEERKKHIKEREGKFV
jgi:hypothetical protein